LQLSVAGAEILILDTRSQRTAGKDAKIKQGVTGVSQQRYVRYMERIFNDGGYHSKRLILDRIVIHTTMKMDSNGGCDPWFLIEENCHEVFDWRKVNPATAPWVTVFSRAWAHA
jgi:hypothetical protein